MRRLQKSRRGRTVKLSSTSEGRREGGGRVLLDILNWSHLQPSERAEFGTLPLQLMPLLLRHKRFRLSGGETCWGERGRDTEQ